MNGAHSKQPSSPHLDVSYPCPNLTRKTSARVCVCVCVCVCAFVNTHFSLPTSDYTRSTHYIWTTYDIHSGSEFFLSVIPAFFTVIYLNFTFQVGIEFPVSIGLLTHGNFGLNGGLTHFAPGTDFSRMRIDFSKMAAYNTCQRKFQF